MVSRTLSLTMFVIATFGIVLHYRFLRAMRFRHPALWESLGKPRFFFSASGLLISPPVFRFLWHRHYLSIPDDQFVSLSATLRACSLIFICAACLLIVALAVSARPTI